MFSLIFLSSSVCVFALCHNLSVKGHVCDVQTTAVTLKEFFCVMYYLVLLLRVLILEFKFLCFQLAYPVPQFFSFFPVSDTDKESKVFQNDEKFQMLGLFYSQFNVKCVEWPKGLTLGDFVILLLYLRPSSLIWSIFNSLRRSLRTFFFFSLSVGLLGPVCVCKSGREHMCWCV